MEVAQVVAAGNRDKEAADRGPAHGLKVAPAGIGALRSRGMRTLAVVVLAQLAVIASARADDPPEPAVPSPAAPPPAEPAPEPVGEVTEPAPADIAPADDHAALHEDNEFGPVILIESITITGNTATQSEIIRRALPIAPGDILHASDKRLRDARFKVLALGFFRDVTLAMHKGSARGQVVIEVHVVERGTTVLNRLWFGSNSLSPYWFGLDAGERNLLGFGISVGAGLIYASHGDVAGSRDQWAGEVRAADGALRGSRWGVIGSLTVVHGSEAYRVAGAANDTHNINFNAFPYRRFGGRAGITYDVTALSRISAGLRAEGVETTLPVAPTQILPDGRITAIDLHLDPGSSRVVTASFGFDRDTRPDPILPHSGGRITANAEVGSGALGGSYDFATLFARYEHWWPLREERQTIGLRFAGGVVIGDAPRFDRIHISDVDHMLTPRALGLVLSNAPSLDVLGTRADKPDYGQVGGSVTVEYAARLFRGSGKNRVYGGDLFLGFGTWALAETADLKLREHSVWKSLPIDLYADAGIRIDTDIGVFELTISNALGRLR
ncbi:MAG: outer membrane protein assembly factor YaeT precursor [Myxococcales bacterium]|nr:outer membrane protein assembly factor YaeT precursor [Myxococcales bacterium]